MGPPHKSNTPGCEWHGHGTVGGFFTSLTVRAFLTTMRLSSHNYPCLYALHQAPAFFVIRSKSNTDLRRLYSNPVDKDSGVRCDQIVALGGFYTHQSYPERLRRIKFYDAKRDKRLTFLTNQFTLPAITIAELYRCRWQVELF